MNYSFRDPLSIKMRHFIKVEYILERTGEKSSDDGDTLCAGDLPITQRPTLIQGDTICTLCCSQLVIGN